MKPIIAIRPEPGASATLAAGRALGLEIAAMPTWEVIPRPWSPPDLAGIDGLLIGSANALRHSGSAHARIAHLPVHAVGQTTAALAREMGHNLTSIGEGGLQALLDALPQRPVHLLRLAGAVHLPLDLPPHVTITTRITYETISLPFSNELTRALRRGTLVLLHSAEAALHFAQECSRLELDRSKIELAALGPRIAAAASTGWADCRSAAVPNDTALLALAEEMCH